MKNIFRITCLLAVLAVFNSCSDDDKIELYDYSVKVNLPEDLKNVDPSGIKVILKNTITGYEQNLSTNSNGAITFSGLPGVFNIEVSGTKTYTYVDPKGETLSRQVNLVGLREGVPLASGATQQSIDAIIQIPGKGWVIKEIYFQGGKTPSNAMYYKDQFVELYNNTDSVLYADGISIGESAHNTNVGTRENAYKNDYDQRTFLQTVYTIPGSGKDVPVKPGESILLTHTPINHTIDNPNALDLSKADYQWYDKNNNTIDVPEVPNLDRHYSYSLSFWILHMQGYSSFAIFQVSGDMNAFITENTDIRLIGTKNATSIGVPNEYILDVVELGNKTEFKYKAFSSSLDVGYTYVEGKSTGRSVRRKIEKIMPDNRVVYKDTNNSALDFIPNSEPQPKRFQ